MAADNVTTLVGSAGAICTTLSFVPQLVKIRRQGGRDLSDGMLMLYLLGLALWLAYGVRIGAAEVIAANVVAGTLVIAAIIMKHASATAPDADGGTRARARTLTQADCRAAVLERVKALQPTSARRWGRMTAHQMLCHLIDCNRMALGELAVAAPKARVPRAIVKWVSLYTPMPWPAGIPTNPELDQDVAGTRPSDLLATWLLSRRRWNG
jgi:MtN3 and saliva related transmembrane protein